MTLRAAVVGLGVGAAHAEAYLEDPSCDLAAVCDIDPARLDEAAERWPGVARTTDVGEVVADPSIDIVSIASFDDAHAAQAAAVLASGKHLFCEKPLCRTGEELEVIRRAWDDGGRPALGVNLVLRAAPLYTLLRDRVASGAFGDVYGFDGDYLYGRIEKITDGWRGRIPDYSVMAGGGVHLVDLMLWMTGQRPAAVTAIGTRAATKGSGLPFDDFVCATFEFESGMIGRVTANFGCVHAHQHVVRIFGTKATAIYDDAGARLHTGRDPHVPAQRLDAAPEPASKGALIPAFVRSISSGEPREQAAAHEFAVAAACIAADEALGSGGRVPIGTP